MRHTVFLCLGGNIGDRELYIQESISDIKANIGEISKRSNLYETEAWGVENQQAYLNSCLEIQTHLSEDDLLSQLLLIEQKHGRMRQQNFQYQARTIDLDILFYDDNIINKSNLIIPHPRIQDRLFVLKPMHDIAPHFIHPTLNLSISQLIENCTDNLSVTFYKNTSHVY